MTNQPTPMLEKIGRALAESQGGDYDGYEGWKDRIPAKVGFLKDARAAITALMEPDKATLAIGEMALSNEGVDNANTLDAQACYRAMLQSVLDGESHE